MVLLTQIALEKENLAFPPLTLVEQDAFNTVILGAKIKVICSHFTAKNNLTDSNFHGHITPFFLEFSYFLCLTGLGPVSSPSARAFNKMLLFQILQLLQLKNT